MTGRAHALEGSVVEAPDLSLVKSTLEAPHKKSGAVALLELVVAVAVLLVEPLKRLAVASFELRIANGARQASLGGYWSIFCERYS